jgi:hypothetical protein
MAFAVKFRPGASRLRAEEDPDQVGLLGLKRASLRQGVATKCANSRDNRAELKPHCRPCRNHAETSDDGMACLGLAGGVGGLSVRRLSH